MEKLKMFQTTNQKNVASSSFAERWPGCDAGHLPHPALESQIVPAVETQSSLFLKTIRNHGYTPVLAECIARVPVSL